MVFTSPYLSNSLRVELLSFLSSVHPSVHRSSVMDVLWLNGAR